MFHSDSNEAKQEECNAMYCSNNSLSYLHAGKRQVLSGLHPTAMLRWL